MGVSHARQGSRFAGAVQRGVERGLRLNGFCKITPTYV
ncbi:hypothetical protein SUS17_820 [Sphingomonas sp. S17]|nr:hypothetical protein SUS17_820 [Sphingomonas sp. S17]